MSQGSVYRWFRGEGLPDVKLIRDFAAEGGVRFDWLLSGELPKHPISRDPELTRLVQIYEELGRDGRDYLLRAAENERQRKEAQETTEPPRAKLKA